jgi:hypothetical protein
MAETLHEHAVKIEPSAYLILKISEIRLRIFRFFFEIFLKKCQKFV